MDGISKKLDIKIITPVIGIPSWTWKKDVLRYAKRNHNLHMLNISDFCYECSRHFDLLKMIDKQENLKKSEYYHYYHSNGKDDSYIACKIKKFQRLLFSIRNNGWQENHNPPIVTEDGCRIDGSHRLSILLYLGIKEIPINIFCYKFLFSDIEEKKIKKQVSEYRKKVYGLRG